MPTSPIVQLLLLFSLAAVTLALALGGRAERIAAIVVIAHIALGFLVRAFLPELDGVIRFANDGLAAVALLFVTLRYGAPWMGGAMLFYAAQFSLHSYYMVTGRAENDYLHALINNINFSGITWCLIIGALVSRRQRVRRAKAASPPAA
ncbi:MAG: hypothetical protein AB1942_08690 [Pseudomonadota bacterium]